MLSQPFKWTDQNIAVLQEMAKEGRSASDAAARLGCSRNAAVGKSRRLGTPFHSVVKEAATAAKRKAAKEPAKPRLAWTQERLMRAAAFWAKNATVTFIAQMMGVTPQNMSHAVKRYAVHFPERVRPNSGTSARAASLVLRFERQEKATDRAKRGFDSSVYAIAGTKHVKFIDLAAGQCKFPISAVDGPSDGNMPCCGASAGIDSPYCNHHHRLAYPLRTVTPTQGVSR